MEKDGHVLIIRRIHVTYHLKLQADQQETAERVHEFHANFCPVYRSISSSIQITTALEMEVG